MAVSTSLLYFSDIADSPALKMSLPIPLPIGTRLLMSHQLTRKTGPRAEVLKAHGTFRVVSVMLDVRGPHVRQIVHVESTGVTPVWKAVKTPPGPATRVLPPAKSPPTEIP